MNTITIIREVLETHRREPSTRHMYEDQPAYTAKCTGCPWIGWDHTLHVAKIIDQTLTRKRQDAYAEMVHEARRQH